MPDNFAAPQAVPMPTQIVSQANAQPAPLQQPDLANALGLNGWLKQLASLGAVGLVMYLFVQDRHVVLEQAREDRVVFRQAIEKLGTDAEKQAGAVRDLSEKQSAAIRDLAEQVRRLAEKR